MYLACWRAVQEWAEKTPPRNSLGFGVAACNATAQPVGTRHNSPLKYGSSRVFYDIALDLLKCLTKFRVLLAAHLGTHATTVRKQVCRSPLYLPFPLTNLRRMHLILAGQFVDHLQSFQRFQSHRGLQLGTMSHLFLPHRSPFLPTAQSY